MFPGQRRSSLPEWAIPCLYAIGGVAAALTLPRLEEAVLPHLASEMSAPVAMAMYSSIGSGMLAFTGIVFSLAFVMVQFSATAYSPRLVLWISRDPVIWHAIGIFTATFLYAMGALAWVDRHGSGKVPFVSVLFVVALLFASVAMFIALIARIGLLQINRMLAFTGDLGRQVIEQMYPPLEGPASGSLPDELEQSAISRAVRYSGRPRTLQALDAPALLALAADSGGVVEVVSSVGDTLVDGTTLLRVFGGSKPVNEEAWKKAFEIGGERTFEQDPKYALRLLVDIAIKALSPAINDPTTAVQALNQIQDLLLRLGRRRLEIGAHRDRAGVLRLVISHPSWEDFLRLAFDEIRFCGATSVQVMRRMKALLSDLMAALPPERHELLARHQKQLDSTIDRSFSDQEEKLEASIEDRQGLGSPRRRSVSPSTHA